MKQQHKIYCLDGSISIEVAGTVVTHFGFEFLIHRAFFDGSIILKKSGWQATELSTSCRATKEYKTQAMTIKKLGIKMSQVDAAYVKKCVRAAKRDRRAAV